MKRLFAGLTALLLGATCLLASAGLEVGEKLSGAFLEGADLSGNFLINADLNGAYLDGADLSEAILRGAQIRRAFLEGANLREAVLTNAKLHGSFLDKADLTQADLRGAELTGAFLHEADLSEADLSEADLTGVSLTGATLAGVNFSGAIIDDRALSDAEPSGAWIWIDRPPEYYFAERRWHWKKLVPSLLELYNAGILNEYKNTWIAAELRKKSSTDSEIDEEGPSTLDEIRPYLELMIRLARCANELRAEYEASREHGTPVDCDALTLELR